MTAMSERSGVSKKSEMLCWPIRKRYLKIGIKERDGTVSREEFQVKVGILRQGFKTELEEAVLLLGSPKEKRPLAKTLGTCKELLKWESALWTFARHLGVEPTNNAAEQALRPAVIWTAQFRQSVGSGQSICSTLLTVITTLNVQGQDVLEFLTKFARHLVLLADALFTPCQSPP
jgi:hypothetical protein